MLRSYSFVLKAKVVENMSVSVVLLGQPTYLNANDIGELLNPIFNVVVANMNVVRYAHAIVGGRKSASVEKLG